MAGWEFVTQQIVSLLSTLLLSVPVALVLICLIFRRPLSIVLQSLSELQFDGATANFGKKLERALQAANAAAIPLAPPDRVFQQATSSGEGQSTDQLLGFDERLLSLAEVDPSVAVHWAWSQLRAASIRVCTPIAAELPVPLPLDSPFQLNDLLYDGMYIDTHEYAVLNQLADLSASVQSNAKSAGILHFADAVTFGRLAKRMIQVLNKIQVPRQQSVSQEPVPVPAIQRNVSS